MRYFLIKEKSSDIFSKEINKRLEDGWRLHGETFVYKIEDNVFYTQAVIKELEESIPNTPGIESVEQILASWNC